MIGELLSLLELLWDTAAGLGDATDELVDTCMSCADRAPSGPGLGLGGAGAGASSSLGPPNDPELPGPPPDPPPDPSPDDQPPEDPPEEDGCA